MRKCQETFLHRDLFGADADPVGKQIQIRRISFTVVGVFKPKRYGSDRERMGSLVFTPLSTFQQVFNKGRNVGFYAMVPEPGFTSREVGDEMKWGEQHHADRDSRKTA